MSPPPEADALITLVLVLVDVVPFRLADKEVVEPHRGAHTNEFCVVVIIIITHTLGKCYSLSLSLSLSLFLAKRYRLLRAAARVALLRAYSCDVCVPRSRSLLVMDIVEKFHQSLPNIVSLAPLLKKLI